MYWGCDYASHLYATTRLLNIKLSHNVAQITLDLFVYVMKNVSSREKTLPSCFYYTKILMKKLGMWVEKLYICPNECMLFYKEILHVQECLHCNAERYLVENVYQ